MPSEWYRAGDRPGQHPSHQNIISREDCLGQHPCRQNTLTGREDRPGPGQAPMPSESAGGRTVQVSGQHPCRENIISGRDPVWELPGY